MRPLPNPAASRQRRSASPVRSRARPRRRLLPKSASAHPYLVDHRPFPHRGDENQILRLLSHLFYRARQRARRVLRACPAQHQIEQDHPDAIIRRRLHDEFRAGLGVYHGMGFSLPYNDHLPGREPGGGPPPRSRTHRRATTPESDSSRGQACRRRKSPERPRLSASRK